MNKFHFVFSLLLLLLCNDLKAEKQEYYPYRKKQLWGLSDENGKIIIPAKYINIEKQFDYFIAYDSFAKLHVFSSQLKFLTTGDSVINVGNNKLCVLQNIPRLPKDFDTTRVTDITSLILGFNDYQLWWRTMYAKAIVLADDSIQLVVQNKIIIGRGTGNNRNPLNEVVIDSAGYLGFYSFSTNSNIISPHFKRLRMMPYWYYLFYNSTTECVYYDTRTKGIKNHNFPNYLFDKVVSYGDVFTVVEKNNLLNIYNTNSNKIIATHVPIGKGGQLLGMFSQTAGKPILTIQSENGMSRFMDSTGRYLLFDTAGIRVAYPLWFGLVKTFKTITDPNHKRNDYDEITGIIDLKNEKYLCEKKQVDDTIDLIGCWYYFKRGNQISYFDRHGNKLFSDTFSDINRIKIENRKCQEYHHIYGIRAKIGKPYFFSSLEDTNDTAFVADEANETFWGSYIVRRKKKFGLLNKEMKIRLPIEYDSIKKVQDNIFILKKNGKRYYADTLGRKILGTVKRQSILLINPEKYYLAMNYIDKYNSNSGFKDLAIFDSTGKILYQFSNEDKIFDFNFLNNHHLFYRKLGVSVIINYLTGATIEELPINYLAKKFISNNNVDLAVIVRKNANNSEERITNVYSLLLHKFLFNDKNPSMYYSEPDYSFEAYSKNAVYIKNHQMIVGIYTNKGVKLWDD